MAFIHRSLQVPPALAHRNLTVSVQEGRDKIPTLLISGPSHVVIEYLCGLLDDLPAVIADIEANLG